MVDGSGRFAWASQNSRQWDPSGDAPCVDAGWLIGPEWQAWGPCTYAPYKNVFSFE